MEKTNSPPAPFLKRLWPAAALALALFGAQPASAQDALADLKFSGGIAYGYSSGDYNTTRTTDISMALATLAVETGNLKFSVSLPYMTIDGRGLVVFDAAGNPVVINRNPAVAPDVRTGWGDLYLGASYAIPASVLDNFAVTLTARFKIPTAPERRRLGTGEDDYGFSVDVSRAFGSWSPFVTIGYLVPGQPVGYALNNMVSVSTGTSYEIEDDLVAIVAYDFTSASSPRVDTSQDMMASLSWIATDNLTFTAYATSGLSGGSPNTGAGVLVSYGFN